MSNKPLAGQIRRLCRGCGACCMEIGSPPFVGEDLPEGIRIAWELAISARKLGGWKDPWPCVWLDRETMQCRHYAYRPEVCRDFQPGSEDCREWRRSYPPRRLAAAERRVIEKRQSAAHDAR